MKEIKKPNIFLVVFLALIFLWMGIMTTISEGAQTDSGTTSTEKPQEKKK